MSSTRMRSSVSAALRAPYPEAEIHFSAGLVRELTQLDPGGEVDQGRVPRQRDRGLSLQVARYATVHTSQRQLRREVGDHRLEKLDHRPLIQGNESRGWVRHAA